MGKFDEQRPKSDCDDRMAGLDGLRGVLLLVILTGSIGSRLLGQQYTGGTSEQWQQRSEFGCSAWDLLPAGFLFCAGASLFQSFGKNTAQGWPVQFAVALRRALILVLLGIYLDSYHANQLIPQLKGDLQLVGLATFFAFLVLPLGPRGQLLSVVFLLVSHSAALVIYGSATGASPWTASQTLGLASPRALHFAAPQDPFVTLHVLTATATVLLGSLAGALLGSSMTTTRKVLLLAAAALAGIAVGWLLFGGSAPLAFPALVPLVRHLASASYVLFAAGWSALLLALLYALFDGCKLRTWSLPLTVLGMNSLVLFVAFALLRPVAVRSASLVLPTSWPDLQPYRPFLGELLVAFLFGLIALWLYRRRIFIKA